MSIARTGRSLTNARVLKTSTYPPPDEVPILHRNRQLLFKNPTRAGELGCSHSAACKASRLPLAQPAQKERLSERFVTRKSHSAAGSAEDRGSPVADALATSSRPVAETLAGSFPLH